MSFQRVGDIQDRHHVGRVPGQHAKHLPRRCLPFRLVSTAPASGPSDEVAFIAWFAWLVVVILIAIAGLLSTLRKWEQLGAARTTSRCDFHLPTRFRGHRVV